uniref:Uncharacterized protein n=1 Tax=Syphacia muris TaxID=451379 RepID=A0A0N5AE69_9BILA
MLCTKTTPAQPQHVILTPSEGVAAASASASASASAVVSQSSSCIGILHYYVWADDDTYLIHQSKTVVVFCKISIWIAV